MRSIALILFLCLFGLSYQSQVHAELLLEETEIDDSEVLVNPFEKNSPKGLPEEQFAELKQQVRLSPSIISTDQERLRVLTSEQFAELIKSMNLGHHSFLYPVRIKGEKLTLLLGRELQDLSLMAVWDGQLQAIPFQFDEYDNKFGYIHIKGVNPFPIAGKENVLDGRDELSFMYRDAGEQRFNYETHLLKQGKVELELSFTDIVGRKRYAYIVSGIKDRSELDYINVSVKDANVTSSFYYMEYDPANFLVIKDMRPHLGKASDERVVDMIYFMMSANVFSKIFKVSMNSYDNIRVKVLGAKDGPIRSVLFLKISVLVAGIPVFSMFSEVNVYEQGIVMPNRAEIGKGSIFVGIFKNPEITIFLDLHGLQGGKVSADAFEDEAGKLRYGIIDGKMDDIEKTANKLDKPGDWIWLNSGLGWDVFMTLSFPEDKFEGMETSLYYLDNMKLRTKGETFPGAEPRLGMRVTGLPKNIKKLENLDLEYAFWYPDTVGDKGPRDFYKHLSSPPELKVNNLSTSQ